VFDIIHPSRRNLTAIRGYVRLGGLPDNPRTDPQDRSWFGPHDRLFTEEESEALEFLPGPEHGMCANCLVLALQTVNIFKCGVGDGMVQEIWMDQMSIQSGNPLQANRLGTTQCASAMTAVSKLNYLIFWYPLRHFRLHFCRPGTCACNSLRF
jgi:hypothetical protein